MPENRIIKSLGHYKRSMKTLNNSFKLFIQKKRWPFTNSILKQKTIHLIEEIQSTIAYLGYLNKFCKALHYTGYFFF